MHLESWNSSLGFKMGIQEELGQLEYLSLVSKVWTELDNHLNMNDKTLAEFVIDLADKNRTMEAFRKSLIDNGADFSGGLMRSLFDLVTRMRSLAGSSSKVMEEAMAKKGFQYQLWLAIRSVGCLAI